MAHRYCSGETMPASRMTGRSETTACQVVGTRPAGGALCPFHWTTRGRGRILAPGFTGAQVP
eukprot:4848742-Amphidinium_carterae.3